jgi:hypothetical protein
VADGAASCNFWVRHRSRALPVGEERQAEFDSVVRNPIAH